MGDAIPGALPHSARLVQAWLVWLRYKRTLLQAIMSGLFYFRGLRGEEQRAPSCLTPASGITHTHMQSGMGTDPRLGHQPVGPRGDALGSHKKNNRGEGRCGSSRDKNHREGVPRRDAKLSKGCPRRGAQPHPRGGHLASLSHQGGPREDSLAQTAASSWRHQQTQAETEEHVRLQNLMRTPHRDSPCRQLPPAGRAASATRGR